MSEFEELAPLYGVGTDSMTVLLVGGERDGETFEVPVAGRSYDAVMWSLMHYYVGLSPRPGVYVAPGDPVWSPALTRAEYQLLLDGLGQPSRDDEGRIRLGFRGLA